MRTSLSRRMDKFMLQAIAESDCDVERTQLSMNLEIEKAELASLSESLLLKADTPRELKIVAEGDSWFDYPLQKDIIDNLREMGYAIAKEQNTAKFGDTLENMVYGTEFKIDKKDQTVVNFGAKSLDLTVANVHKYRPAFVLFSAGGNDVVGEELIFYLNHKASATEDVLRKDTFDRHVKHVLKPAILKFVERVLAADPTVHILMDGYDYPLPTGDMVNILGLVKKGPWILPSMGMKGITDRNEQVRIIRYLVSTFNAMLQEIDEEVAHFHHVSLLDMFPNASDWHNEIHLYKDGYAQVAQRYHAKIVEILGYNPLNS